MNRDVEQYEPFETREEFARSFVRSFKQAMTIVKKKAAGEELPPNDFEEHISRLKAESEIMRAEDAKGSQHEEA